MDYRLDKMSKKEKKELAKYCQFVFLENYKKYFPNLPDSLVDVSSKDVISIASIEGITGVKLLEDLLQLRTVRFELEKRL